MITFLKHHYVLIIILLLFGHIIGAALAIFEAWMDTRKIPREDMYWCNKHGAIRKKHCLPLFPGMTQRNGEPFIICPHCVAEGFNSVGDMS